MKGGKVNGSGKGSIEITQTQKKYYAGSVTQTPTKRFQFFHIARTQFNELVLYDK